MYRSRRYRIIAGVCGGLAERFGMPPTLVRLLFLLSFILPGTQVVIYLIMWVIFPNAPGHPRY